MDLLAAGFGVQIPVWGYVVGAVVIAGIFAFAVWRNKTGANKKK